MERSGRTKMERMKTAAVSLVAFACLLAVRGVAPACHLGASNPCPLEKESSYLKVGNDLEAGGYLPSSVEKTGYLQAVACPDIAATKLFEREDLEYVHSVEFAEAVFAVATGKSRFSPGEIPAEWLTTAYAWGTHIAASKTIPSLSHAGPPPSPLPLPENGNVCSPSLLFRASLEYRSTPGHEEVKLVYPHKARAASESLSKSIRDTTAIARTQVFRAEPMRTTEEMTGRSETDDRYGQSVDSAIRWVSEHTKNSGL